MSQKRIIKRQIARSKSNPSIFASGLGSEQEKQIIDSVDALVQSVSDKIQQEKELRRKARNKRKAQLDK